MTLFKTKMRAHSYPKALLAALALLGALWALARLPSSFSTPSERPQTHQGGSKSLSGLIAGTLGEVPVRRVKQSVKLLLSTHNRLFWFHPATQQEEPVHEGQVRCSNPLIAALPPAETLVGNSAQKHQHNMCMLAHICLHQIV